MLSVKVDVLMAHDLFVQIESADLRSITVPSRINYCVSPPANIKEMVDEIIKAVPSGKKISVLRIWSHGVTAWRLGDGGTQPNENGVAIFGANQLSAQNVESFQADLVRLKPLFENTATVELRGCALAKGTGKDLMKKLAKIWGVSVIASSLNEINVMWKDPKSVFTTDGGEVTQAKNLKNAYGQPQ